MNKDTHNILVVVDMQNDFITGVLGSPEAQEIVPRIAKAIEELNEDDRLIFTQDSHEEYNYEKRIEGKSGIPFHCCSFRMGFEIEQSLLGLKTYTTFAKDTFGSDMLVESLKNYIYHYKDKEEVAIHVCGVCTDICVISNVLMLRSALPYTPIVVHGDWCAGTSVEAHNAALQIMKNCCCEIVYDIANDPVFEEICKVDDVVNSEES